MSCRRRGSGAGGVSGMDTTAAVGAGAGGGTAGGGSGGSSAASGTVSSLSLTGSSATNASGMVSASETTSLSSISSIPCRRQGTVECIAGHGSQRTRREDRLRGHQKVSRAAGFELKVTRMSWQFLTRLENCRLEHKRNLSSRIVLRETDSRTRSSSPETNAARRFGGCLS